MHPAEKHAQVEQLLLQYKASVYARDVDAFVSIYDDDVAVFDMWDTWSMRCLQAWRAMVADWFGSLGAERVVVEFDDVHTIVTDDLAVVNAFVTYAAVSAEGVKQRALNNRMTMVMSPRSGTWKIVHEHSSAPIDSQTTKARLQR